MTLTLGQDQRSRSIFSQKGLNTKQLPELAISWCYFTHRLHHIYYHRFLCLNWALPSCSEIGINSMMLLFVVHRKTTTSETHSTSSTTWTCSFTTTQARRKTGALSSHPVLTPVVSWLPRSFLGGSLFYQNHLFNTFTLSFIFL